MASDNAGKTTPSSNQNRSAASPAYHEQFGLPSFEDNIFLVFGYGSILWKQNFEFDAEYTTYIKGYQRLFYQGSSDHRGVPGKPGRVVTLLPADDAEARVYGKAYQLPTDPEKLNDIFTALDVREQGGYVRLEVPLYAASSSSGASDVPLDITAGAAASEEKAKKGVVCLCYIATADNEEYLGEAPLPEMAAQILNAAGPSGPNREYLFNLADCLRAIGASDDHVFSLDAAARQLLLQEVSLDNTAV